MTKPIYVKPPNVRAIEIEENGVKKMLYYPTEEKVEKVEEVVKPKPRRKPVTEIIEKEEEKFIPVEREKVKQAFDFSPEQSLSRFRTFAPAFSYDYDFAPEDFSSTSQVFSPSQSYDTTFAPKRSDIKRSVYSPSTITNQKYAPSFSRRVVFKPRLFDKLLAIFAPQAMVKQRINEKYKPYDYTFQQTAIIDTYDPEQLTTIQKFAPKDENNFNLRIAPEADLSIKLSPPPISFTSVDYYGILKKILR